MYITPRGQPQEDYSRPIYPACLLVRGRRCLVVGGGKVARRKVEHLLAAEARVWVVAPTLDDDLAALVANGAVRHRRRPFRDTDVSGCTLVIAATDDGAVNRAVGTACQQAGVWCNLADKQWISGDFVTPAVLRRDGVTVAISTGGRSCRRSRLIKDNLERHLAITDRAELLVLGTSHDQLDQAARARFHLDDDGRARLGAMILQLWGVHEFQLLDTCNRVEVHAVVGPEATIEAVLARILGFAGLPDTAWYRHRGFDAFAHVATVAAGLASQSLGEAHIQAQLKAARAEASTAGWGGGMLGEWLDEAGRVAKALRARLVLPRQEIEDQALAHLAQVLGDRPQPVVLVIGAGPVGQGVVAGLPAHTRCRWCYRRHRPSPPAGGAQVACIPLADLAQALDGVDAVVCAAGGSEPVLGPAHVAPLAATGAVVLDLGQPRNVADALVAALGAGRVVDLDGLKRWHRRHGEDHLEVLVRAQALIADHQELYDRLMLRFHGRHSR